MKRLAVGILALASTGVAPVWAQSTSNDVVRFTGFLGDLRFEATDLRADLFENNDDNSKVAIVLNEDAAAEFLLFTRTHINQSINMFICGQQVATATVQTPVESGYAASDAVALDTAIAMVDALNGLGDCPG